MPQLQPGDFAPQLVWLAITFAVLYLCLARIALPRIAHALAQRSSHIDGDLQKARDAQKQSELEAARYEADLLAARTRAQQTLRAAREKLDAEFSQKRAKVEKDLASKSADAQKQVTALRDQAASSMEIITADVVGDIVKELVGVEVSESEIRQALRPGTKE